MALIVISIDRTKLPPHTDADFKAWVQFQVNEKRNILEDNPLYLCDMEATVGDIKEHEELVKLAVELRGEEEVVVGQFKGFHSSSIRALACKA